MTDRDSSQPVGDREPGEAPRPPRTPDDPPVERPPSGALRPVGEDVAWSALGSLLAGPIVWGGVGMLLDWWRGTGRVFTALGVVAGTLTSFYIVYLRFGRED